MTTYRKIPNKLSDMKEKFCEDGMDRDNATCYVGECMDDDERLFTSGNVCSAMLDVYDEAIKALKEYPDALATLKIHFN